MAKPWLIPFSCATRPAMRGWPAPCPRTHSNVLLMPWKVPAHCDNWSCRSRSRPANFSANYEPEWAALLCKRAQNQKTGKQAQGN